jgi:type I restriction enzyme, S subunit
MKSNYRQIGKFIQEVENNRNTDLKVTKLLGLSMTKEFRETTSNIIGTDMSIYKVMQKWQFACDFMSPIRVNKLPVVLKMDEEPNIVSPAYPVFEVKDRNELDPEYLMMWFRRPEFDRYATFKCDSAIRGGYDWEELCNTEIPVPHIDKQREIVTEYNTILHRIDLNNQLIQKLEETAQAIYKQWFVDFEFPNENGELYKSAGGEMVESELGDIPKGWEVGKLKDILIMNYGKALPVGSRLNGTIKVYSSAGQFGFCNKALVNEPSIIVGRKGSIGTLFYEPEPSHCIDTAYFIKGSECKFPLIFIYDLLRKLDLPSMDEDSAVPGLNRNTVYAIQVAIPKDNVITKYSVFIERINSMIMSLTYQNQKLTEFQEVLLSKLATVEN